MAQPRSRFAALFGSIALLSACGDDGAPAGGVQDPTPAGRAATPPSAAGTIADAPEPARRRPATTAGTAAPPRAGAAAPPPSENVPAGTPAAASQVFCGVLDVMRADCHTCHGSARNAGAPMSLVSYEDFMAPAVTEPALKVYQLVSRRIHETQRPMPPAGMLVAEKLATIDAWTGAGAPPPAMPCAPAAENPVTMKPSADWPADCEETYRFIAHDMADPNLPYQVPANTEEHPRFPIDAPWGDTPVQMLASRPITDNSAVIHHWILWDSKEGHNLVGWAPGGVGDTFPSDVGLHLPSGAGALALDMHYFNTGNGQPAPDRSGVEICITRNFRPKMAVNTGLRGSATVPAKSRAATPVPCTAMTTAEVHFLGVNPHMHQLGVHGRLELSRGGGPSMVLHDGPFAFTEQAMKPLPDVLIQTGDILTTTCTFENTTELDVEWGESTKDEMCINWVRYYPKDAFRCEQMDDMEDTEEDAR
jgi:hypothetical protein